MSHFHIVHPTGLLYILVHDMPVFECNSMKFGKHVVVVVLGFYVSPTANSKHVSE